MADESTQAPVGTKVVVGVLAYLIAVALLTAYTFIALWSAQPRAGDSAPIAPQCSDAAPKLTNLYPDQVTAGVGENALALGCNFPAQVKLSVNGRDHGVAQLDAHRMSLQLTAADVAAPGLLILSFSGASGNIFATGWLTVVPGGASGCVTEGCYLRWYFLGRGPLPISIDVQLLLLVLMIGAFGASVYSLKSIADYRGDNKLLASWLPLYFVRPLMGSGAALLLYFLSRAGFLSPASDSKNLNQFGICAIAGLAGMFSDIAFLKLREVFQTLFKPADSRGGKPAAPSITTTSLPDGQVGADYKQSLAASDGKAPLKWTVAPDLPAGLKLDPATGAISGRPVAALAKSDFKFTVTDSAGAIGSAELTLQINSAPAPSTPPPTTTAEPQA
ncbi:MAG TPA: Ig domain-containing protein [Bryobacteraceae bacterium]|nr:Ig domain-containing protein [Bryobacteraceae bacterium]